jgi:hypothetical protein
MCAIEFTARVRNGTIEVPDEYRGRPKDTVRVIVMLAEAEEESPDIIDALLERPLQVPGFVPLSREQVHADL